MRHTNSIIKRRYTRFKADRNIYAALDANSTTENFNVSDIGLVINEAYGGCGLVIRLTPEFQIKDKVRVKVGGLGILMAEVVWRSEIENDLLKIGLMYL